MTQKYSQKHLVLSSWNVNGLRASWPKGLSQYLLDNDSPLGVLGIQEAKVLEEQIPSDWMEKIQKKYEFFLNPAQKKGYSGVGLFIEKSLVPDIEVINHLPEEFCTQELFNNEGRVITCIHSDWILINAYYPNGQRDLNRVPFKLAFSEQVILYGRHLEELYKRPVFYCGDFNTAHKEIDSSNPKQNQKTTGFLPVEREWMDHIYADYELRDLFREFNPDETERYTWWTYRSNCREKNVGWRIDYFWAHHKHLDRTLDCKIRSDIMGSDHCPVELYLKV